MKTIKQEVILAVSKWKGHAAHLLISANCQIKQNKKYPEEEKDCLEHGWPAVVMSVRHFKLPDRWGLFQTAIEEVIGNGYFIELNSLEPDRKSKLLLKLAMIPDEFYNRKRVWIFQKAA